MRFCIPNPVKPSARLWLVPDVVHLFKSLKQMLCSNVSLTLPEDIVQEFGLGSNEVHVGHIEWLEEYQRGEDLKFAPRLKFKDIHTPHFGKMQVKSSYHMFNGKTAAALSFLVAKGIVSVEFEATAWFVALVDRWREIVTARTLVHALGEKNKKAFEEAIAILELVIRVFKSMKVKGGWKAVQTHIIIATEAMLEITKFLLKERGYDFVLLGRFLQDMVENLFSVVRLQRPVPSVEFKYRLKQCTLSQYMQEIKNSSYDYADTEDFVDLLLEKMRNGAKEKEKRYVYITKYSWHNSVPI